MCILYLLETIEEPASEAGISKNYCATNSGSPKVDLGFYPWLILFKYRKTWPYLSSSLYPYYMYI